MRAWVLSDLHIDVNQRYPLALPDPPPPHDVVVIAGDICQGVAAGLEFIAAAGLDKRPVVYVAGNHEYYGRDRFAELEAGRAAADRHPNIHFLERDSTLIDGVRFLGCTLWTDYRYAGPREQARAMQEAARRLTDHRLIANGKRTWTPQDALEEHEASRAWLARELGRKQTAPTVVVTHHAPSPRSVQPVFRGDLVTAAFASDLEELMPGAVLWVHGHLHARADYRVGSCRVVANPRGYVGIKEDRSFNPGRVIEISDAS